MHTSKRKVDGYEIKKQLHGHYKIVEYSHYEYNGSQVTPVTKRTRYRDLTLSEAEDKLYKLEKSSNF